MKNAALRSHFGSRRGRAITAARASVPCHVDQASREEAVFWKTCVLFTQVAVVGGLPTIPQWVRRMNERHEQVVVKRLAKLQLRQQWLLREQEHQQKEWMPRATASSSDGKKLSCAASCLSWSDRDMGAGEHQGREKHL